METIGKISFIFKDSLREAQKPQNMYFSVMLLYQLAQTDMAELYINQKNLWLNYYLPLGLIHFNVGIS